jgi:hypothetical protein
VGAFVGGAVCASVGGAVAASVSGAVGATVGGAVGAFVGGTVVGVLSAQSWLLLDAKPSRPLLVAKPSTP